MEDLAPCFQSLHIDTDQEEYREAIQTSLSDPLHLIIGEESQETAEGYSIPSLDEDFLQKRYPLHPLQQQQVPSFMKRPSTDGQTVMNSSLHLDPSPSRGIYLISKTVVQWIDSHFWKFVSD